MQRCNPCRKHDPSRLSFADCRMPHKIPTSNDTFSERSRRDASKGGLFGTEALFAPEKSCSENITRVGGILCDVRYFVHGRISVSPSRPSPVVLSGQQNIVTNARRKLWSERIVRLAPRACLPRPLEDALSFSEGRVFSWPRSTAARISWHEPWTNAPYSVVDTGSQIFVEVVLRQFCRICV